MDAFEWRGFVQLLKGEQQVARLEQALDDGNKDEALLVLATAWQLSEEHMVELLAPRRALQVRYA